MNRIAGFHVVAVLLAALPLSAIAQQPDATRIKHLESQLRQVETDVASLKTQVIRLRSDVGNAAGPGAALFLFGVVCALWAQNTGRNPWLWFFLGLFFSVITGLVMLYKNSQDREQVPKDT